jgi:hypothetical protein
MASDTTGANALMMLDSQPGVLTASWSGADITGGLDMLIVALGAGSPSTGAP